MSESAIQTSGPSLEQILWRAMDRWTERPALVDSEEFAAHIAAVFDGDLPAEAWVERFFEGQEKLHKAPADVAEAMVRATKERLHVYEFDLNKLEYVIVEDKEKVVVVSDFGQFALKNDDMVSRAIEAAVIPTGSKSATPAARAAERNGSEPRAYFVRASGEVVAVDVKKVARSLEQLLVKQVSMPAVDKPSARLLPFAPVRRTMTEAREEKALRQDPRTRAAMPLPPRLMSKALEAKGASKPPPAAQTALFVLMPDGTLARPEIGSATRWQEMVGQYAARNASAVPVNPGQRFTVVAGNVVAIINSSGGAAGTVGERALARAQGISAVRGESAPVRVLGDDELVQALQQGAMVVPGLSRADKFWIQPEAAFKPDEKKLMQGATGSEQAVVSQLGQITGDPWSDWALSGGGEVSPDLLTALRGRTRHALRAALDRPDDGGEMSVAPELAHKLRGRRASDLLLAGAPVVGFRSPDGSIVVQHGKAAIRLAAADRPTAGSDLQLPGTSAPLAARSGAIPATALAALQMALERTAATGGYKLPILRLDSASDALDVGSALQLDSYDPRRGSVRLAGPVTTYPGGASGQVAQLMLSMPFPNQGELHVGDDLSEALQAYLGGQVSPASGRSPFGALAAGGMLGGAAAGGVLLRLRGGEQALSPGDDMPLDWGGLHTQASQRAQDAVITLDLPMVQPLLAGSPSTSGLPLLLQRALQQSGDWTPGPGAPMPIALRDFAMRGPFDASGQISLPELITSAPVRPLNPGEEEIVIPMPLWAQMGRGHISETEQIMASPLASTGYTPPMGVYRLVVPAGGPVDMTGGAPPGTPGIVELFGPTGLELVARPGGSGVFASSLGGKQIIGQVALDDGETLVGRRGRIRVGAPISNSERPSVFTPAADSTPSETPDFQSAGESVLSQGGEGSDAAPALVSSAPPSAPSLDAPQGTFVDGTYTGGSSAASTGVPMTGALSSAMRMSDDVNSRSSLPSRPSIGSQGTPAAPGRASDGGNAAFSARAQAAGQRSAGTTSLPSSQGGGDQTLVVAGAQGAVVGAQVGSAVGDAFNASSSAGRASDAAASRLSETPSMGGSSPSYVSGLAPGMWSGHRRDQTSGYQSWSYAEGRQDGMQTSGGVDLAGLSRPVYPSLPTSLRFRYVGAPLWWSGSTRSGGLTAGGDSADEGDSSPATRALRSGLRAANSAASIWRSILVAGPKWGGESFQDSSGGMDQGHDASADEMSSLSRRFDSLGSASLVGAGAAAGGGAAYVAVNSSGGAGVATRREAARARANAVEMSIVAAIPPTPPPLESMGSGGTGGDAPHARGKGHGHGGGHGGGHKEAADQVSHSKIEGSVDAIAQRIYHRIRRRIQSDRERFGG
jgi:hypothetical protein